MYHVIFPLFSECFIFVVVICYISLVSQCFLYVVVMCYILLLDHFEGYNPKIPIAVLYIYSYMLSVIHVPLASVAHTH